MWIENKQAVLILYFLIGQYDLILGCIAPSYNASKGVAYCSDDKVCPPDASHCQLENPQKMYGKCCLGCDKGLPEPKMSCMRQFDCKNKDPSKRYKCIKPGHNVNALGVCCENIRGY